MPVGRRHYSPYDSIHAWMSNVSPRLSFDGVTEAAWRTWREGFDHELRRLLGPCPCPAPLCPEVLERTDCGTYTREKVVFDSEAYSSVLAYVLVPKDVQDGERRPAILAAHGHGKGKSDVCGIAATPEDEAHIAAYNYDYAHQFARRGYVVVAPDWRGFGERSSPPEWARPNRDPCNVNYMAAGYAGYQLLALQIWDGMRTVDYMCARPEVDPERLGVAGLSFGGTMAMYLGALEPRLRVVCISGYLSTVRGDAMGMRGLANFCGSQYMPGLLTIGDIPEVAGLIAPKPLIVEMGEQDQCFVIDDMKAAHARLERIYSAAGACDRLAADIHPGGHAWSGAESFDWFARWL